MALVGVLHADELDSSDEAIASRTKAGMDKMKKLSRPYLVSAVIEDTIRYMHTMNPLMSTILESLWKLTSLLMSPESILTRSI